MIGELILAAVVGAVSAFLGWPAWMKRKERKIAKEAAEKIKAQDFIFIDDGEKVDILTEKRTKIEVPKKEKKEITVRSNKKIKSKRKIAKKPFEEEDEESDDSDDSSVVPSLAVLHATGSA